MKLPVSKGVCLVALVTFALYVPGFWWGAPHATSDHFKRSWGTDDEAPLGPLAEMHNIVEPKPDRNLGYPLLWSFVVAGFYVPYLGLLWLTGDFTAPSGSYPYGLSDPIGSLKVLTYIAHFATVLMGVGVAVFAFLAAKELWGQRAGFVAAALAATCYPMFYYVRNSNVDVPMLFFVAGASWAFALVLRSGTSRRNCILLGIFLGGALATKESAAGSFLLVPLLFWLKPVSGTDQLSPEPRSARGVLGPFIVTSVSAFLALGLGSGLFVEPSRYFAHLQQVMGSLEKVAQETSPLPLTYTFTWQGHVDFTTQIVRFLADILTWPGLLLCTSAVVVLVVRERRNALLPLTGLTSIVFLFFVARSAQMRYMMPAAFGLCFASARLLSGWLEHRSAAVRKLSWVLLVVVVGTNLMRGASLTHEMLADSRYDAAQWLEQHTDVGDRIDFFGPASKLPPLKPGLIVQNATKYEGFRRPLTDPEKTATEVLQRWRERPPKYIVLVPDLSTAAGKEYNFTCPQSVCDQLIEGDLAFPLQAEFRTQPIFDWFPRPALDYPTVNPPIRIFAPRP